MYIVRNVSKQEIALGDLRIALKSGQQLDLDMICSRYVAEQSPSLKTFVSRGMLKIITKDTPGVIKEIKTVTIIEKDVRNEDIRREIRESEQRIVERQDAMLRKHLGDVSKKGLDQNSLEALQQAITALQQIAGSKSGPSQSEKESSIDDVKAVDIQTRTIDRLSKNTQGKIKSEETKSQSSVDGNIDELDKMLGE